jgi:hypothetical protein
VVVLLGGLVVDVAAHRHDHRPPVPAGGSATAAGVARRHRVPRTRVGARVTPPTRPHDPFTEPATRTDLAARTGTITAAVEDLRTHRLWLYHPDVRVQTASIEKVDILETLLHQAEIAAEPLDDDQSDLVQSMIENSNDEDAQDLWDSIGGSSAVAAYNSEAGLTQTVPNSAGYWGETTTSAADQIRLLRQLVAPHALLNRASQDYQLRLMENVEADQAWGVSAGVAGGVSVALKNGWVPLTGATDWEVNSIGRIKGDGRMYLIAILTAHDPSQAYGIETIEGLSTIVWSDL